jgi:hypothetical protein
MTTKWRRWRLTLSMIVATSLTGTVMDAGCFEMAINNTGRLANYINPCGTILNCDPFEYDLLTTSWPDYTKDPSCTIPGLCGGPFPLNGGGGTGTTNTNTNTNTNTTTN